VNGFALELKLHAIVFPACQLVDHGFSFAFSFVFAFFRGRPPSLPFSRELAAFRFDLASPRQAGQ
jgi:hypothetical protein